LILITAHQVTDVLAVVGEVAALDADDTLRVNEPLFQNAQYRFGEIMREWIEPEAVIEEHYRTERVNLPLFGFGIKGFVISLIETAIRISSGRVRSEQIEQIIQIGRYLIDQPGELIDGVEPSLERLNRHYRLILVTKGDLLDQERKLERSGLEKYFHHVEVMSDKSEVSYRKLLQHLDMKPSAFLMIGNSLKSDVQPVLNIGANAIHVPFEIEWVHEKVEGFDSRHPRFLETESLIKVCDFLNAN